MVIEKYYLGCPIWNEPSWVGSLYRKASSAGDFLSQYAHVFNAVEGNTTFYGTPSAHTVQRWCEQTSASFRVACKFPRGITHDRKLRDADAEVTGFLQAMAMLGERAGRLMIQLPPTFAPPALPVLDKFLQRLPREFTYSVEFRHRAFYESRLAVEQSNELLERHRCGRTIIDTRGLRAGRDDHPAVLTARHKKPNLKFNTYVTASMPFLRFVGHPDTAVNTPFIESWAETIAQWLGQGFTPYVFIHTANNVHAPELARELHRTLSSKVDVGEMPEWLTEEPTSQLDLFSASAT